MTKNFISLFLALMLGLGTGCIFKSVTTQGSFESSSKTVSAPFKSMSKSSKSSKSSSGGDEKGGTPETTPAPEESAFERDIRQYTASYATTSGDAPGLQRDIGEIASQYGVTDWESQEVTYSAIGRGLGEGSVDPSCAEPLAVAVANGNEYKLGLIRTACEAAGGR